MCEWLKYWNSVDFYLLDEFSWLNFSEKKKKKQKTFTQIDVESCWNKQKAENLEISRESHQTERNRKKRWKRRSRDFEVTHDGAKRTKYKRALEKETSKTISKKEKKKNTHINCKQNMLFFCSHELFEDNRKSSLPSPLINNR